MDDFIHRENLALFKRKLAEARDEGTRQTLMKLIADEEAKPSLPPKIR
jgi:hypothetical protein